MRISSLVRRISYRMLLAVVCSGLLVACSGSDTSLKMTGTTTKQTAGRASTDAYTGFTEGGNIRETQGESISSGGTLSKSKKATRDDGPVGHVGRYPRNDSKPIRTISGSETSRYETGANRSKSGTETATLDGAPDPEMEELMKQY